MSEMLSTISEYITADNVALLSVVITVLLFVFTRRSEIQYKKHDDKKIQYLKLIQLMEKMYIGMNKDNNGNIELTDEMKKLFFDTGASLLLYGSKKIYKLYLLFREFTSNPLIKQCKYYSDNILIYVISEMLVTMRKEVGLSSFGTISNNEALGFFVNDISSNPIAKKKEADAKFRIKMIKIELFLIDRLQLIWINRLYTYSVRMLFAGIRILFKYIIVIPFGKIVLAVFPKAAEKLKTNNLDGK